MTLEARDIQQVLLIMMPSRGMGVVSPGKLPKKMRRRDNPDDFDMYAAGGRIKQKRKRKSKQEDKW